MKYTLSPTGVENQQTEDALQNQKSRSPYGKTPIPLKVQKGPLYLPRHLKTVWYESKIEHNCLWMLSYDPEVIHIDRAAPVTFHAPDGTPHTYEADFDITRLLSTGQEIPQTLECKPNDLLLDIISGDPLKWAACAEIIRARGSELLFVTDEDLKPVWLEHAKRFGTYQATPGEPEFESLIIKNLARGPVPFQTLRATVVAQLSGQTMVDRLLLRLDSTLSSLIARGTVRADTGMPPNQHCLIGLPGQISAEPLRVRGVTATHLVRQVYATNHQPSPKTLIDERSEKLSASAIHLESKLLATPRGQAFQKLFSLYSDPSVRLNAARVQHLMDQTDLPRRTIFRFQTELRQAGAPGITFSDLVPYLHTQRQQPTRQLAEEVQSIVATIINTHYLVPVGTEGRCTGVANLHKLVSEACEVIGKKSPALTTIQRQLQLIRDLDPVTFETRRNGADAGYKTEARLGEYPVLLYGELLAIDCTPCDVFTTVDSVALIPRKGTKKKRQGKPGAVRGNVIQIIEVATRQVLSSRIYLGGVKAAMVLRDLQLVLLGDFSHAASRGVVHLPTFAGLPRSLRLDSGVEFLNQQIKRVIESLGIQVIRRNKSSRHHGGVEERAIGTVISAHHILSGTTMSNIGARQGYRALQGAKMDFDTLDTYHQRMVEVYNRRPSPQKEVGRNDHASQLIAQGSIALRVPSAVELKYIHERLHPQQVRKCARNGIYIFSLRYSSQEASFRGLVIQSREVEVVFDPAEISTITVVHPDTGQLIPVQARFPDGIQGPMSLEEWQHVHRRMYAAQVAIERGLPSPQKILGTVTEEKAEAAARLQGRQRGKPKKKGSTAGKVADQAAAVETYTKDRDTPELLPFYGDGKPS
jgi:hypothetical protein